MRCEVHVTQTRWPTNRWSLAWKFSLASLIVLLLTALAVGWWVSREIRDSVVHRLAANAALTVSSLLQPELRDLSSTTPLSPERMAALEGLLRQTPLGPQLESFKLWGLGQRVLYSNDTSFEPGRVYPAETELDQAWTGALYARYGRSSHHLGKAQFVVYTPLRAPGSERMVAVAEFSLRTDDLERALLGAQTRSWLVVGLAMLGAYLLLVGLVKRGSDTINRQGYALITEAVRNEVLRERVQRAASRTVALNERFLHRISAELHDGPTQELTFALLKLDGLAQHADNDADICALEAALDRAMRETRAIASGLRLPDLEPLTLREVLDRTVRDHKRRTESDVSVSLETLPENVPLAVKITAFRVIQEALTNAFRHGGGIEQRVHLKSLSGWLVLEVCDGGPGFDCTGEPASSEHLGLAGMRERVESIGGGFEIASMPGHTRITVHLPLQLEHADE
jgi:signal transduction histidine kinase